MAKQKDRFYFGKNIHDDKARNQYLIENREYLKYVLSFISLQRYSKQGANNNYTEEIMEEASQLYSFIWKRSRNSMDREELIRIIRVLKTANGVDKETINIASEPLSIDYMYALVKMFVLIHKDNEHIKKQILDRGWDIYRNDYTLKNESIEPEMDISLIPSPEYRIHQEKSISYSDSLRNNVIYEFLFNNKPIGWLEMNLVPREMQQLPKYKNENKVKDVSVIILNGVGLNFTHKGFFQGVSLFDTIEILEERGDFKKLVEILKTISIEKSKKKDLQDKETPKSLINEKQKFVGEDSKFAEENQSEIEFQKKIQELPTPVSGTKVIHKPKKKSNRHTSTISEIPLRDALTSKRALAAASYLCEIDQGHEYFKSKASQENYVEAHHLIPIQAVDKFDVSIDVEANIVSLCPNCHRKLHHAEFSVIKPLVMKLHEERRSALKKCHISILLEELLAFYK
ncbi:HNH endonuclease [Planococcus rifietoensis]|uniref:HNH endonuclease n=1 Tax=Planococcus rifietoensis TaxID=200991 RepID=UPI00384D8527